MPSYDSILIGAGLNSLAAAVTLAKAGQKVLVLEKRAIPGGAASTSEIIPGFLFDNVLHGLGPVSAGLWRALELDRFGPDVLRAGVSALALTPEGPALPLFRNIGQSSEALRRFSQADAQKWPEFAAHLHKLAGLIAAVQAAPIPSIDTTDPADLLTALGLGNRLRALGGRDRAEAIRTLPMSVAELLDDWFETDALKGVLGFAGVLGLAQGPRAVGTAHLLLHHHAGAEAGALRALGVVRGGLGKLAEALVGIARQRGAEVRFGAEVAQIAVEDERATGVILADGQEIPARVVISGLDPRRTFFHLLDPVQNRPLPLDPTFLQGLHNIKYRGVVAKINLALSGLPNFGVPSDLLRGVISLSPSLDYLERAWDAAKYGEVSPRPALEMVIPTLLDPSRAPERQHVLSIWLQYAPYHLHGDWDDNRKWLRDLAVNTVAQIAPDLPGLILGAEVLNPVDLQRHYGLSEGSLTHGDLTLDQIFFMRPVPGWSQYATPISGLYLCGAGTHPGTRLMPGYLAARKILGSVKTA